MDFLDVAQMLNAGFKRAWMATALLCGLLMLGSLYFLLADDVLQNGKIYSSFVDLSYFMHAHND
jgi:hypothetical protein